MLILSEEQLNKRFNSLPDHIKKFLMSEDKVAEIKKIGESYYLDEDKYLILENLVGLVILGFLLIDDLAWSIKNDLHLSGQQSAELSKAIINRVLLPIENDIRNIYFHFLKENNKEKDSGHRELIEMVDVLSVTDIDLIFKKSFNFSGQNIVLLNKALDNYIEWFKNNKSEQTEKLKELYKKKRNLAGSLFYNNEKL